MLPLLDYVAITFIMSVYFNTFHILTRCCSFRKLLTEECTMYIIRFNKACEVR